MVWLSLGIAVLVFGAQVFLRPLGVQKVRAFFYFVVLCIFGLLTYWTYLQYSLWASGGASKYFLPPYQGITYFIGYVGVRIWGPWIVALFFALLIPFAARAAHKRLGERFFEDEEPYLIALGIFLSGYPGFLFYIPVVLILGLLLTTCYSLLTKRRAPFYFLWMPAAIIAILITHFLIPGSLLVQFNL